MALGFSEVLLAASWALLGAVLGPPEAVLGPLGPVLGPPGVVLGCSQGLRGRSWPEKWPWLEREQEPASGLEPKHGPGSSGSRIEKSVLS